MNCEDAKRGDTPQNTTAGGRSAHDYKYIFNCIN